MSYLSEAAFRHWRVEDMPIGWWIVLPWPNEKLLVRWRGFDIDGFEFIWL